MIELASALALDAVAGERPWQRLSLPHPVVLIGRGIGALERRLNRGTARRLRGAAALGLVAGGWTVGAALLGALPGGWLIEIAGAAILIAHRSLVEHVQAVATGLRDSTDAGRLAVSMIVGRDPEALDANGVARAAIESAAENFSDGVVAPVFWFAVAGLPGIVAYKVVNTADSMIGHRSERYRLFGWAAARVDDAMNLIPARLTGVLIAAAAGRTAGLGVMLRDARLHRSPNAGWPEAAMADALGLALAGPRTYAEGVVDDPYMNPSGRRDAGPGDIDRAVGLLWRAWVVLAGGAALVAAAQAL